MNAFGYILLIKHQIIQFTHNRACLQASSWWWGLGVTLTLRIFQKFVLYLLGVNLISALVIFCNVISVRDVRGEMCYTGPRALSVVENWGSV